MATNEEMRLEASDSPAAAGLLAAFTAEIADLYPGWGPSTGPSATPADFAPPGGAFVVAYTAGGEAVACGGSNG